MSDQSTNEPKHVCCCGQSKTGFCDGTHIANSHSFTRTEEITLEEAYQRYGEFLTDKQKEQLKTFIQPQQFQHPFGDDNVLTKT